MFSYLFSSVDQPCQFPYCNYISCQSLTNQPLMKSSIIILFISVFVSCAPDWTQVDRVIQNYIANRTTPGAVLGVANSKGILYTKAYGALGYPQNIYETPTTLTTKYDLASLTKVVATLSAIMHLYDDKLLDVEDKVSKFIPEYDNNMKRETTIKNLLLHNAGLLPDYPYAMPAPKQTILNWTFNCKLDYPIGTKFVYSDLSFVLLAEIAERITKRTLQDYTRQLFVEMGMKDTGFLPDASEKYRIAPTTFDPKREKLLRGQVHDPTAYSFGGVAGSAGLFSSVNDLLQYMRIHLNGGQIPGSLRIYPKTTVDLFSARVDGLPYQNRRALGWDTVPIQDNPPCGHKFSANSFGHTGYTGTMVWSDKDKDLIIVLLTNRVHPSDVGGAVQMRSDVSDAIVDALGF